MLKVTTWNVNGVRAREQQVLEWVQRERPDVICLQEVHRPAAPVVRRPERGARGAGRAFTWWAPWRKMRERNIGWRVDYVLASAGLASSARGSHLSAQ